MTSNESNNSNAFEADGIHMEIILPELVVLAIPENQSGAIAPIRFNVRIINNTSSPFPFKEYRGLIPELVGLDSIVRNRQEPIDSHYEAAEYDCSLIMPEEKIVISLDARFYCQNNYLKLEVSTSPNHWKIPISSENSWFFDALLPGIYKIRFTYNNSAGKVLCINPETGQLTTVKGINANRLVTPFANLRLVSSIRTNHSAVEFDGIRFENIISEQVLSVPRKTCTTEIPVKLGLRITNNTSSTLFFDSYRALTPEIIGVDGHILQAQYISNALITRKESDFCLVQPGKDVTFFSDANLFWSDRDLLTLRVSAGDGGFWFFHDIGMKEYQVRLNYQKLDCSLKQREHGWEMIENALLENVWVGRVDIPFVLISIVQQ